MATPAIFIVEQYSHFSCFCWKRSYLSHKRLNIVIKYKYKGIPVQVIKSSGLRVFRSSNAPEEHGVARRWCGLQDPVLILLRWWRAWQKTPASSVPIGTQIWGRKEALATGNLRPGCCYFCFFFFTRSASPLKYNPLILSRRLEQVVKRITCQMYYFWIGFDKYQLPFNVNLISLF